MDQGCEVTKQFIGIDPGVNGGIAAVWETGACCTKMPGTQRDIYEHLNDHIAGLSSFETAAWIETVNTGFPGSSKSSVAKLYGNFTEVKMALVCAGIPVCTVSSSKWQKAFNLPSMKQCGNNATKKKNAHKAKAQELFPSLKITHAVSDALLIAEYARRFEIGSAKGVSND